MHNYKRTHTCNELSSQHIKERVWLSGWVHRRRDHGGLIFIDLRDRYGLTQLVFKPEHEHLFKAAEKLRSEWTLCVEGIVEARAAGMANKKLSTGDIEIIVEHLFVLSESQTPPFEICDADQEVSEDLRLKYRYLDIRRGRIAKNLIVRHRVTHHVRNFFHDHDFLEITTPILGKSTPEGARDYLVPSRVHPGTFYALPQSPQIFKQLLMLAGMDRYFQIATCFRDEDLRADRQPEFSQIDIEASFVHQESFMPIIENMIREIFEKELGIQVPHPLPRMSYKNAIEYYGSDKPDLRFGMRFVALEKEMASSEFSIIKDILHNEGIVKSITVPVDLSRKEIDGYIEFVKQFGLQGLSYFKAQDSRLNSNIAKFFTEKQLQEIQAKTGITNGQTLLIAAGAKEKVHQALDHLRRKVAKDKNLIPEGSYHFSWITEFPLFDWSSEDSRWVSTHHPFTAPHPDDIALLDTDPSQVRALAYDLVINGYEAGGGSQRIHNANLQQKIFETLKLDAEDIKTKFGFFIDALKYGMPPTCGIAFGLDRIIMLLCKTDNIRDVIAFPKTQKASDLMMNCPSQVEEKQLDELNLRIKKT